MKLLYYRMVLGLLNLFLDNETALANKRYNTIFHKKLKLELREIYSDEHYDMWYDRMWESISHYGHTPTSPDRTRIIIEMGLRLIQNNSLKSLCGIQPMNGPVGLVHTFTCSELPPIDKDDKVGKRLTLELVQSAVKARTRKYTTMWPLEAIQDAESMSSDIHLPDMVGTITKSMDAEQVAAFMQGVEEHATETSIVLDRNSGINADWIFPLIVEINIACNGIGVNTRRGTGNVIWASKLITSLLIEAGHIDESAVDPSLSTPNVEHVGKLNKNVDVYTNHLSAENKVVIGYKGGSETDAGVIIAPYVPILSTGFTLDVSTCQPTWNFMTRNGVKTHDMDADGNDIGHRYRYYHVIDVKFPDTVKVEAELLQEVA